MKVSRLDDVLLSVVGPRWMKVAMVIANVAKSLNGDLPYSDQECQVISERIENLVRSGHLEARGDTKLWRFSEVRLGGSDRENVKI